MDEWNKLKTWKKKNILYQRRKTNSYRKSRKSERERDPVQIIKHTSTSLKAVINAKILISF